MCVYAGLHVVACSRHPLYIGEWNERSNWRRFVVYGLNVCGAMCAGVGRKWERKRLAIIDCSIISYAAWGCMAEQDRYNAAPCQLFPAGRTTRLFPCRQPALCGFIDPPCGAQKQKGGWWGLCHLVLEGAFRLLVVRMAMKCHPPPHDEMQLILEEGQCIRIVPTRATWPITNGLCVFKPPLQTFSSRPVPSRGAASQRLMLPHETRIGCHQG